MRAFPAWRSAALVAAALIFPKLGDVGLWDPWETHYAEVGRQMLARADLFHPYWQNAYFFSKPPLAMWLAAAAMFFTGAQPWGAQGAGPLPPSVELAIRTPFALVAIVATAVLAHAIEARASRRAGVIAGIALATMPLFTLMARQATTDVLAVSLSTITASALLMTAGERAGRRWWVVAFIATGLALLAKGALALFPWLVWVLWILSRTESWRARWNALRAAPWGASWLTVAIAAPWYVAMIRFTERDDEGRLFWERFFVHDHLNRLVSGVHTTTPGGTFTYFIEQGAFAVFPWVSVVPLIMLRVMRRRDCELTRFAALWSGLVFVVMSLSATRFHHYVFPALPGLAVLAGLALDELHLDEDGANNRALLLGGVLTVLVTNDLVTTPRHLIDLFTYNQTRPYPDALNDALIWPGAPLTFRRLLLVFTALPLTLAAAVWIRRRATVTHQLVVACAVAIAALLSWHHWPTMGPHWTQRALIDRYFALRHVDEPLAAFLMNWKGETFYTRNAVTQINVADAAATTARFVSRPGRSWLVVEHDRLRALASMIPPTHRLEVVDAQSTNKFALVVVSLVERAF